MIVEVSTLDDARLDVYARLTEAQLRNKLEPEKGIFIAESGKVIERALTGGMKPLSLLMEAKWLPSMADTLARLEKTHPGTPVFVAPHEELERLTGFELTRGALGAFRRPALPSVEEVCTNARRIAVLENITNHTNVGAIFRSAAALGMDAVLVTPACYDPLYRRAVRVSMGTVFQIPWTYIGAESLVANSEAKAKSRPLPPDSKAGSAENGGSPTEGSAEGGGGSRPKSATGGHGDFPEGTATGHGGLSEGAAAGGDNRHPRGATDENRIATTERKVALPRLASWAETGIPQLRELGFVTAALALSDDSISLDDARLARCDKLALVFGTEGDGLAHSTISRCDYTVKIPMYHGVDSLNVAAASAVAFWELRSR